MNISNEFLLAAELEDPCVPEEVVKKHGRYPRFTSKHWDFLREYGLLQSGYVNTEAQILAFCLAAVISSDAI